MQLSYSLDKVSIKRTKGMYYNKQEMLAQARAAGFKTTQSQFEDWMDKGIVGKAVKREYPGKGSVALWPQGQLNLFLTALKQKQLHNVPVTHLCNLPVWAWIYYGEQMVDVSLPQVRTAMNTWLREVKKPSIRATRKSLQELVELIQSPHATSRRAFINALTAQWEIAEDELEYYLQNIIDPKGRGEARGPQGALLTINTIKNMFTTRADAMKQLDQIPDSLWEWARAFQQFTLAQYYQNQPKYASDPDLGHLFTPETPGSLCATACLDLVSILGMGIHWDTLKGFPLQLQPKEWRMNKMRIIMRPDIKPIGLVAPDGMPFLEYRTVITIVPKSIEQ